MTTRDTETYMAFVAFFLALLIIPVLAVLEGWALTEAWRLLLIPGIKEYTGETIKPLSIGVAIAFAFVLRQFVNRDTSNTDKNHGKNAWAILAIWLVKPFVTVFFAWLLSVFIFRG